MQLIEDELATRRGVVALHPLLIDRLYMRVQWDKQQIEYLDHLRADLRQRGDQATFWTESAAHYLQGARQYENEACAQDLYIREAKARFQEYHEAASASFGEMRQQVVNVESEAERRHSLKMQEAASEFGELRRRLEAVEASEQESEDRALNCHVEQSYQLGQCQAREEATRAELRAAEMEISEVVRQKQQFESRLQEFEVEVAALRGSLRTSEFEARSAVSREELAAAERLRQADEAYQRDLFELGKAARDSYKQFEAEVREHRKSLRKSFAQ
ncbi:MAG: hypothetical protein GY906_16280, partial [bacterium]|nr:hypothetical protein [bacterium]